MAKKELVIRREMSFGVEVEISNLRTSRENLNLLFKQAGINSRVIRGGADHSDYTEWKIEMDGSLQGDNTMEIVSPVLKGLEGLKDLETVLRIMNENGAEVNKTCGLHVHHWAGDMDVEELKNVYKIYAKHERAIDELFPKSRYDNRFAKRINGDFYNKRETVVETALGCKNIEEMRVELGGSNQGSSHYKQQRYFKLNFVSWVKQGTLEFRQHSGTTDFGKISNWVLLTHKMLEVACEKNIKRKGDKRRELCEVEENYIHRNYDLFQELGISGTDVSNFVSKRSKDLRSIGVRGDYSKATY